jgi:hypothetical protein
MLVRADNKTRHKYVTFQQGRSRPYALKICVDGRTQHFGYYATAEEAALEYARHVGRLCSGSSRFLQQQTGSSLPRVSRTSSSQRRGRPKIAKVYAVRP